MKRILFIQYTNPAGYPPLEHASALLARRGWKVLFLGTGSLGTDHFQFPPHPGIRARRIPFCPPGWAQKGHYILYGLWALFAWACTRPAWIYASDPLSCPIAFFLSFIPGVKVLYHEHDEPSASGALGRWMMDMRRGVARRARMCVLPNAERADRFSKQMNRQEGVLCVWNCPSRREVMPPRASHQGERLKIYYHGTIVPQRLPMSVLRAVASMKGRAQLTVVGYETVGGFGYRAALKRRAQELGIQDWVDLKEGRPRGELWPLAGECDVGLALAPTDGQDFNLTHLAGASNKAFEYIACGLALLVPDLCDWRQMYVDPGYGRSCRPEDPNSIEEALRWFLEHPDEMRRMGERGRQRILADWNYERQFQPVLEKLEADAKPA